MKDLPPPDLLDTAGRLRRMFVASSVGIAAAAITYFVSDAAVEPEKHFSNGGYKFLASLGSSWTCLAGPRRFASACRFAPGAEFVFFFTGMACATGIFVTAAIQRLLIKRRERLDRIPRAQLR